MKKRLLTIKSLLVAVLLGVGVNGAWGQIMYSWEGGSGGATETGGTVACTNDPATSNINQLKDSYYTLALSGKKFSDASFSTNPYIVITLDNALAAGDVIRVTGFRNKAKDGNDASKANSKSGIAFKFSDTSTLNGGQYY